MKKIAQQKQNIVKYLLGLGIVILVRLLPHPPNVEPVMSTMMPFSKRWGPWSGLVFSLLAILSFDVITGTLGIWSVVTATTYMLLGAAAGLYLKDKANKVKYYLIFAIIGTLVYDAVTGIGIGMVFFNQTFMTTFIGQIPFTLYHLAGNIVLSGLVSPLIYKWVVANPKLETKQVLSRIGLAF